MMFIYYTSQFFSLQSTKKSSTSKIDDDDDDSDEEQVLEMNMHTLAYHSIRCVFACSWRHSVNCLYLWFIVVVIAGRQHILELLCF